MAPLDATNAVTVLGDHNGLMRCRVAGRARVVPYSGDLLVNGVADSEAVTTLSATTGKNLAAVGSAHATAEAMLVGFLTVRGLECSFHFLSLFLVVPSFFRKMRCKISPFFQITQIQMHFCRKVFVFFLKITTFAPTLD